jgi:hypothetical protein
VFVSSRLSLLGLVLLSVALPAKAQKNWEAGYLLLTTNPTDTLRGWVRYREQAVQFQPTAGPARTIPLTEIRRWHTSRGEDLVLTPKALQPYTPAPILSEVVQGRTALYYDALGTQQYILAPDAGEARPLLRNSYQKQLQQLLPACSGPDSLLQPGRRVAYKGRDLAPLVLRYNRCRWPQEPARAATLQANARLEGGLRAGPRSYRLRYRYDGELQDTDFGRQVGLAGAVFARLSFNQRFFLQSELEYEGLTSSGRLSVPTNTPSFARLVDTSLKRRQALATLLVRYHMGLPVAGRWRPLLLGGISAGYALSSEFSVTTTLSFPDSRPAVVLPEDATAARWSRGYVAGAGVEIPVGAHRPTLELRYHPMLFQTTGGTLGRQMQVQATELQLSWAW